MNDSDSPIFPSNEAESWFMAGIQAMKLLYPKTGEQHSRWPDNFSRYHSRRKRLTEIRIQNLKMMPKQSEPDDCPPVEDSMIDETNADDLLPTEEYDEIRHREFAKELLSEMEANISKANRKSYRYSRKMVMFSYILRSYSNVCYEYLRKVLPLPSRQVIYKNFKEMERQLERSFRTRDLDSIITSYFERAPMEHMEQPLICTLSVDAFSMSVLTKTHLQQTTVHPPAPNIRPDEKVEVCFAESFEEKSPDDEPDSRMTTTSFNNVFLLVLNPLNWEKPPCVISAFCWTSGHASPNIVRYILECIEKLKNYNIEIRAIATDGDPGYNCLHNSFSEIWKEVRHETFVDICDAVAEKGGSHFEIDEYQCRLNAFPIADPLHALKIARSRVLTDVVYLTKDLSVSQSSFSLFMEEKWCHDTGQLTKMNDYYALSMFSPETFIKCWKVGNIAAMIYLWPWLSLVLVIRVPFLSIECRRSLLHGAFNIFQFFYNQNVSRDFGEVKVGVRSCKGQDGRNFFEPNYLLRVIHLILCLDCELSKDPEKLRLSSFGSHITENIIGRIRVACHGNPQFEVIMRATAKAEMRRIFQNGIGVENYIRGRDNTGGAKIGPHIADLVPGIDFPAASIVLVNSLKGNKPEGALMAELARICEFLTNITENCDRIYKIYPPNSSSNSGIMARLIAFESSAGSQ